MARRIQFRRIIWLGILLAAGYVGLGYRLVDLQVLRHEELSIEAQKNTQKAYFFQPRRGDILDARGNLLATSVPAVIVCADPSLIGTNQAVVAHAIAPLLQMDERELAAQLAPRLRLDKNGQTITNQYGQPLTNQYVRVKRKVSVETWQAIHAAMTNLTFGVDEKTLPRSQQNFYRQLRQYAVHPDEVADQIRVYPNGKLAAHVLGYVDVETVGMDGIERTFNTKLAGVRGWRLTETDVRRREVVALRDQDVEPCDGLNVVLSIDSVIQHIVESELAAAMEKHTPKSISGIVVRPRTGEIVAMATLPNYDPNDLNSSSADARRNRVIADVAEPGSTFKTVIISGALNDEVVKLSEVFDCEHGFFRYGGRPLHDHESYGSLSVEEIIMHSSNIGAAKVGIKLGENRVYDYIRSFGFGTRSGIPLSGELVGIVHPVSKWSKVSIAQIPMGQGIAVTSLQMLMAICTIANQGVLMRPMLVDRLEDRDRHVLAKYTPQPVRRVISERAAKDMVTAMKTVVSPEGTAPKAALEHYTVAGKTGTAQKVENGVYVRKYFSSFIGFFPADNPEICISVVMDDPPMRKGYYGGQVAAPVFKQIAERLATYLNIPPEDSQEPLLPDPTPAPEGGRVIKTAAASP